MDHPVQISQNARISVTVLFQKRDEWSVKVGKSKFYDLTATQEIEKEEDHEKGSFFAGGPGAEEVASSAEASPGPVKRESADIDTAFEREPEIAAEQGMIGIQTILFQLQPSFLRLH